MIKFLKRLFCRHNFIEVAFAIEEVKASYHVLCPNCSEPITIKAIGYSLRKDNYKKSGCPKKVYLTEKDAQTSANWCYKQGFSKGKKLRHYYCSICEGYHLTKLQK